MAEIDKEFREKLLRMDPYELQGVHRVVEDAITRQMQAKGRGVSEKEVGTAKDSAVQRLAAMKLRELRLEKEWTFSAIGDHIGVTRERVYQIWDRLCKIDAEQDRAG